MDIELTGMMVTIIVQIVGIGIFIGVTSTKLKYFEKKMDKHNGLIERMVVVEQSCKSVHKRIDRIHNDIKE